MARPPTRQLAVQASQRDRDCHRKPPKGGRRMRLLAQTINFVERKILNDAWLVFSKERNIKQIDKKESNETKQAQDTQLNISTIFSLYQSLPFLCSKSFILPLTFSVVIPVLLPIFSSKASFSNDL